MGFKFNDKVCVIDINDVKYSVTFQKALVDRLNEAKGVFTAMKDSADKEDISKVCGVFDKAIDSILGVGAASSIFAGRFESIAERYAVLKYIYKVIVYGTEYGADRLANIRLSRSLDGKGFYGVSTTCFSCDIYTDTVFSEGAAVVFDGYSLPTFYIASQSRSNGVSHIECYDRCKNLDIPFDYSGYEQFEKKEDGSYDETKPKFYPTSSIIGAVSNQCGFKYSSPAMSRVTQMCYNDIAKKSCRQIIEDISKIEVGWWYANGDNSLAFTAFSPNKEGFEIAENDRSEIQLKGTKAISGIVVEDEIYGGVYSTGAAWQNSERLSARCRTAENAGAMMAQILSGGSYEYNGWECPAALVSMPYAVGNCIAYGNKVLPILDISCDFTALGIIAAMSAPAPDTSFSEYQDLYSRQLDGAVKLDRVFGCAVISQGGFGLVGSKEAIVNNG